MSVRTDPSRALCFRMLSDVIQNNSFSNLTIRNTLSLSHLTEIEKSFATALFYGTVTHKYTLDFYLRKNLRRKFDTLEENVYILLLMGAWQLIYATSVPSFAAVNETVKLSKQYTNEGGVRLINAVLRALSRDVDAKVICPEKEKFDVRYSLNRELSGCLISWYGKERAESLANAFLSTASITARVNRLKTDTEDLIRRLSSEGVTASADTLCPDAIRLSLNGKSIAGLKTFRDGFFMIQDEGAMLASYLLRPTKENNILDVCSAPGGKACHLAEQMGDSGRVLALDISTSRLNLVEQNQERLGIRCIDTAVMDASCLGSDMRSLLETFDAVLCDVPCSGLGLLHRKPDIRHSMTYQKMQDLIPVQYQILNEAARFVKKNGILMYSTCTVNPNENGAQVDRFLLEHPDFAAEPFDAILPAAVLAKNPQHQTEAAGGRLALFPDVDGCDGFFIAKMRRKP